LSLSETIPVHEVTAAEAVTQCLVREGIDRVFGIPGGYFTTLFDAFARAGLKSYEGRHEGAAACMAAGWAQTSGKVGVVYTQCGPGTTNAITGLAAAYMDSIPLLLLASQVPRDDYARDGHQETTGATRAPDQLEALRTMTQFVARPPSPASLVRSLRVALNAAVGRRGPAAVEIASDLLSQVVKFEDLPLRSYRTSSAPVDEPGVEQVCRLLRESRTPVVLVGDRVAHSNAASDLVAWCEEQDIAVATVDYAKGVIAEDHPLSIGVLGQAGHASAREYLRLADLVVLLGVRMTQATTIRYTQDFFRRVVQIDDDPREIGRSLPVEYGIVGDLPATIRALRVAAHDTPRREGRGAAARVAQLRQVHQTFREAVPLGDGEHITPIHLFHVLREELPRETLIVSDTGWTAIGVKAHFPVYAQNGFFALYGLAPMGSGLPMSLGVQLARPDAQVVSIIGDGGFLVHIGELNVAVQHDLPVLHVVVKNGLYKSVADRQKFFFNRHYATEIPNPSYSRIAEAFGCLGFAARTGHEVREAVRRALAARRPAVIEVDVAYDDMIAWLPGEMKGFNTSLFGTRREDWPFGKK
jgi:acetolactate synthase I/II/III large subunit